LWSAISLFKPSVEAPTKSPTFLPFRKAIKVGMALTPIEPDTESSSSTSTCKPSECQDTNRSAACLNQSTTLKNEHPTRDPLSCRHQLTLIKIASGLLSASSAKNGPIFTQGPHHVAKKSTNTVLSGVAMTASNKNDLPIRNLEWNVASNDNNAELGIVTTTSQCLTRTISELLLGCYFVNHCDLLLG
jgi:hypothetical protein